MAPTKFVLDPPTGILGAIQDHREAWSAFQIAPQGRDTELAELAMDDALERLVGYPCGTLPEVRALAAYLLWYVEEKRHSRDWTQFPESAVLARASDLALLLGHLRPSAVEEASPAALGFLVARVTRRLAQAGEILAVLVLIGGGAVATSLATLI